MDRPLDQNSLIARFRRWFGPARASRPAVPEPGEAPQAGQDRVIARAPRWRRWAIPGAAAVGLAGAAMWWSGSPGGRVLRISADQLTIATVRAGRFDDYIAVRGTVAPLITAYLTSEQGGTVKRVLAEDGDMVAQGQPLVILSNPALQLQVAAQQLAFEQTRFRYQQDLLTIEHQIGTMRNNLARDKLLLDGKAIAPSAYQQEQDDLKFYLQLRAATLASRAVEQRVRATQVIGSGAGPAADITSAGVEALTIRAPMRGRLTGLDAEVGQAKPQGAVLGQVNSADRFKLTAAIDEYYLGRVTVGQDAVLTIDGRTGHAQVSKVFAQVTGGTFKTEFRFDGAPPPDAHVGQAIDLQVQLGGAPHALLLANGPFYRDTGGNWAFVLAPDGRSASRRAIRLGRNNPDDVEVTGGLRPGERVIVSGYEAFQKVDRIVITHDNS